jgi:hypothetical protein
MKLTNAHWEQRNLGVKCFEMLVEAEDTPIKILECLHQYETEYTVVRVPVGFVEISMVLQSVGYTFIEVITTCRYDGAPVALPPMQSRMVHATSTEEMNSADINQLVAEINNDLFLHDRISLDPRFGQKLSNKRYIGWLFDELHSGSKLFNLIYKQENIGFFVLKKIAPDICRATLGAVYAKYQKAGFGLCMNYHEIMESNRWKARSIFTSFSSNNENASAIHFSMAYKLDSQYYVFIKHNNL